MALLPVALRAQAVLPRAAFDREFGDQWLVWPLERLAGDQIPPGTIGRVLPRDFLVCLGAEFSTTAAPSPGNDTVIVWAGASYRDAAAYNNEVVRSALRAGLDERPVLEQALARIEAGLAADPQFLPFLYNAGRLAHVLGDYASAARYLERARDQLPEFAGIHLNLGLVYFEAARIGKERAEQAVLASLRTAARQNPFEREAHIALGDVYLGWDNLARAREYYEAVLVEIPDSIDARIGLARVAMAEGRWNDARRLLEESAVSYPGGVARRYIDHSVHYYRGLVYRRLGAHALAVRELDRMLAYPEDPLFLEISRSALRRLREQSASQ